MPTKVKTTQSSQPVWAHSSTTQESLRKAIVDFCAGRDTAALPPCDVALIGPDLATNEASALELYRIGVMTSEEARGIAQALLTVRTEVEAGEFQFNPELEDIHINIEEALRERAGDAAGKIHSGRSRNDQVACDIRLWQCGQILGHLEGMSSVLETLLERGLEERATVQPGFTHHQHAFITTLGHLMASHAEAWLRDMERGLQVYERVNRCPLGGAASFGTSWPIDRNRLASLLGFTSLIRSSLDAVSSRLEVETDVASWLAMWMTHSSCLAQDLILFSMEEFRWIRLAPEATTGSSIMPQKRNPDFAEVIKGKTAFVHGALSGLHSLGKGQPSGYHRDSQISKPLGQDIWREVMSIPVVLETVIQTMEIDRERMRAATQGGFLEAAEWADAIAQESRLPFRQVYRAIGIAVDNARAKGRLSREIVNAALRECGVAYRVSASLAKRFDSPEQLIAARKTLGSPNPEKVEELIHWLQDDLSALCKRVEEYRVQRNRADAKRLQEIRKMAKLR